MSALIEAHSSTGQLIGRCDETCYNSKGKRCNCICGGRNHGIGKIRAMRNNTHQAEQVALTIARATDLQAQITRLRYSQQLPLPLTD